MYSRQRNLLMAFAECAIQWNLVPTKSFSWNFLITEWRSHWLDTLVNVTRCDGFFMGQSRPLYVYFRSFLLNNSNLQQCEKCPSCIRHRNLNSQPLDYESLPLTIRPGFPSKWRLLARWFDNAKGIISFDPLLIPIGISCRHWLGKEHLCWLLIWYRHLFY